MAFTDTLSQWMPTFFGGLKSSQGAGGLPMPRGGGRTFWWGNGTGPIYPGGFNVGRSIDYAQAAGDVTQNSAVAACLNWLSTNWGDAPLKVGRMVGGKFEPLDAHPLVDLLAQPNEDFNGKWLTWALLTDYFRCGRAYVHVVAPGGGEPQELQWLPAQCMTAIPDAAGRLLRYDYKPAKTIIPVDKHSVVHFRFGADPNNPLDGVPPLAPVLAEIVSDNACARYPANMMHHGGLPPGVFTLKPPAAGSNMQPLNEEIAKALMTAFNDKLRNNPGDIPLIPGPLEFTLLGWKPSEMELNDLREEPETRIAAQFGIPALVVGLRAGMIRSTYSNTKQAIKAAWTNGLIPLQSYFASEWTRQLLPYYAGSNDYGRSEDYGGGAGLLVQYDHSGVKVLADELGEKREQARKDHAAGLITHDEARSEQGRPPLKDAEKSKLKTSRPAPERQSDSAEGDGQNGSE